jgi:hypothetical protein
MTTWRNLTGADRRLLNDVLHGRRPHSDIHQLPPEKLDAAIDYYRATGTTPHGNLPKELIRDYNQARIDYLRTGKGQPPGGIYDFAEGWLKNQSRQWLDANRTTVDELRQTIDRLRQRARGG